MGTPAGWQCTVVRHFREHHRRSRPFAALPSITGTWVDAGNLPALLSTARVGDEFGPTLQLPDGRVWQVGATNNTAYYNPATNTWAGALSFPANLGADDAPGAMLPNGHALVGRRYDFTAFTAPTKLYDFDPVANSLTLQTTPSALTTALNQAAFLNRMLVLPNGDILMTTSARQLWEYTPDGAPQNTWRPTVSSIVYNGNLTYTLTGTQLNGLSEGASYGDDAEMSSDYPIVRLDEFRRDSVLRAHIQLDAGYRHGLDAGHDAIRTPGRAARRDVYAASDRQWYCVDRHELHDADLCRHGMGRAERWYAGHRYRSGDIGQSGRDPSASMPSPRSIWRSPLRRRSASSS